MPKIGFPMPTAKNQFQILNLHPKKHVAIKKKTMVLKEKITINTDMSFWHLKIVPLVKGIDYLQVLFFLLLNLEAWNLECVCKIEK